MLYSLFTVQRCAGFFVNSSGADQLINLDRVLLALAVQSGVCLLVVFQVPAGTKPDDIVAALLHIEAVSRTGRVRQQDVYLAGVPVYQILFALVGSYPVAF